MTILGYDINGQPLRAGDRVVIVGGSGVVDRKSFNGIETTVVAENKFDSCCVDIDVPGFFGGFRNIRPSLLRKLPPKQADNETTTWESIEQLAGWVPEGVRV